MAKVRRKVGSKEVADTGLQIFKDVFEAAFELGEAAALRARSEIIRALHITLAAWKGTRSDKAAQLKITPARLDVLLKCEGISNFSLSDLIKIAVHAGLSPSIQFDPSNPKQQANPTRRETPH